MIAYGWTQAVLFDRRLVRAARVAVPECMGLTDAGSMIGRASASAGTSLSWLIHRRDVSGFDRWLIQASDCAVPELRRFAAGLKADLSAVRAAFTSQWSSGQVEGQVNRLKFLKRQMYGRAKLDLLRVRVLNPN